MKAHTELYLHLVWSTRRRRPMITPPARELVYRTFRAECHAMRVSLIAVGGIEDHVHLLVRTRPTIPVASLVKRLKGVSSRLVTRDLGIPFGWQRGYGAFAVSGSGVERVRAYILDQERHHASPRRRPRDGERPPRTTTPRPASFR